MLEQSDASKDSKKRTASCRSPSSTPSPPHQRPKLDTENKIAELLPVPEEDIMDKTALIEAFVAALSDPRVTAALNTTIESKVESIIQPLCKKVGELENENKMLKSKLSETAQSVDSMEQHSRRNNLRIWTKITEQQGENTDDIVIEHAKSIGIELSKSDICRSHRVGRLKQIDDKNAKIRPILVRFTSYRIRNAVYTAKKKSNSVFISEDLTAVRNNLLYKAKRHRDAGIFKYAWSRD